jgi:putative nucleotidyltransferase with HDIG domain
LPAAVISPLSGSPPWITNFSVMVVARVKDGTVADPTRQEAWDLVCEWVQSDSLRKHLLGVEAAMVAYARKLGGDEEMWAVTGLVHDLDYERHPDLQDTENGHPRTALRLFEELGWPQEVIDAVAGHATFLGVPRETDMAKALFAVDELSGFIAACALVRPTGIEGMKPKSVKKKLKQPSFAAGVNRDEVYQGAEELGVDFDEHVAFVIAAMEERADELGLGPRE